jgi:hypothetical protein
MKRLDIVQPYVPVYRIPFFEELIHKLEAEGIECRVLAGQPRGAQRRRADAAMADWVVEIPSRELSIGGRGLKFGRVGRHLRGADAVIVGHMGTSWDTNSAVLAGLRGPLRVGLWGHSGRT